MYVCTSVNKRHDRKLNYDQTMVSISTFDCMNKIVVNEEFYRHNAEKLGYFCLLHKLSKKMTVERTKFCKFIGWRLVVPFAFAFSLYFASLLQLQGFALQLGLFLCFHRMISSFSLFMKAH